MTSTQQNSQRLWNRREHLTFVFLAAPFIWMNSWRVEQFSRIPWSLWLLSAVASVAFAVALLWVNRLCDRLFHRRRSEQGLNLRELLLQVLAQTALSLLAWLGLLLSVAAAHALLFASDEHNHGMHLNLGVPLIFMFTALLVVIGFMKSQRHGAPPALILRTGKRRHRIPLSDIICLYSEDKVTHIQCKNQDLHLSYRSLKAVFQSHLNVRDFFQANRQFIVNRAAVSGWKRLANNNLAVALQGCPDLDIQVNKNRTREFLNWINA